MRSATWKNSVNQFVAVALLLLPAYGERWFAYSAYAPEALFWRLLEMVVVLLAIRGVEPLARGLRYPVMMLAAVQSVGFWQIAKFTVTRIYILHFSMGVRMIGKRIPWAGWPMFFSGLLLLHLGVAIRLWKGRAEKPFPATEA